MDKQMQRILEEKRNNVYADPLSVLKKFDTFLENNGIYHSFNEELFYNSIKGKAELCEYTVLTFFEATYDNEKEFLLNCLLQMGYDRNVLVELVLDIFKTKKNEYLWNYADFLYSLKNYEYLDDYIKLISDKEYGTSRQMIILLVGESNQSSVVPYLLELCNDETIVGHVLIALSHYDNDKILTIMKKYVECSQKWVSDVAKKYLKTH